MRYSIVRNNERRVCHWHNHITTCRENESVRELKLTAMFFVLFESLIVRHVFVGCLMWSLIRFVATKRREHICWRTKEVLPSSNDFLRLICWVLRSASHILTLAIARRKIDEKADRIQMLIGLLLLVLLCRHFFVLSIACSSIRRVGVSCRVQRRRYRSTLLCVKSAYADVCDAREAGNPHTCRTSVAYCTISNIESSQLTPSIHQ